MYILGAGATRGAFDGRLLPPPVDTDFFEIVKSIKGHGTPRLAAKVLRSVWELYQRTSGISLERYYRDIETRAKILEFVKPANQPKNWKKRAEDLQELIRRVYIHTTCQAGTREMTPVKSHLHQSLLSKVKEGDVIVTFNYDLVIEEAFEDAKIWNPIDGYCAEIQGKTHDWCRKWLDERKYLPITKSKILLLKLHGSMNWFVHPNGQIKIKPRPFYVRAFKGVPVREKISILAPGWNKRIDRVPYRHFWEEAYRQIEKCGRLVIIGYSLPETDLLAQALFCEVIRQRVLKRNYFGEVHLVDPSDVVRSKILDLFTPALGPGSKTYLYENFKKYAEVQLGFKEAKNTNDASK